MATVKSTDYSRAKHKAISGRFSDCFSFPLSENGSVSCMENVCRVTFIKPSHIMDLTLG